MTGFWGFNGGREVDRRCRPTIAEMNSHSVFFFFFFVAISSSAMYNEINRLRIGLPSKPKTLTSLCEFPKRHNVFFGVLRFCFYTNSFFFFLFRELIYKFKVKFFIPKKTKVNSITRVNMTILLT